MRYTTRHYTHLLTCSTACDREETSFAAVAACDRFSLPLQMNEMLMRRYMVIQVDKLI